MSADFNPKSVRALLRSDLTHFTARCFQELNGGRAFLPNWHHLAIATKLEACRRGECRRLIINLPPRHLKSLFASVAFPTFWLGHDPGRKSCASASPRGWRATSRWIAGR